MVFCFRKTPQPFQTGFDKISGSMTGFNNPSFFKLNISLKHGCHTVTGFLAKCAQRWQFFGKFESTFFYLSLNSIRKICIQKFPFLFFISALLFFNTICFCYFLK